VTGKRLLGADEATPTLPPAARTFEITKEMADEVKGRFERASTPVTRKHLGGIMALVKHFYDVRLKRTGSNTPYEPLFPAVAVNVTVTFQFMDHREAVPVPLSLKNTSNQQKNTTLCRVLYMLFDQHDHAYDWMLQRYLEGMRAPLQVHTAQARSVRAKGVEGADKRGAAGGGGKTSGSGGGGGGGGAGGGVTGNDGSGGGRVGGGGTGRAVVRGGASAGERHGAGGSALARASGRKSALRYPSPPPPLPPVSNLLFIRGQQVGTCAVHLEFDTHHGHTLPDRHAAVFFMSHKPEASNERYPLDLHRLRRARVSSRGGVERVPTSTSSLARC